MTPDIPSWLATRQRVATVGMVSAVVLIAVVLAWVYWPAPGPSPAEDALREQNEKLIEAAKQAEARAVEAEAEARRLRDEADAKLTEVAPIRERRRVARRDGARRTATILAAPDDDVGRVLAEQHERTRAAIERVRPVSDSTESDSRPSHRP